MPHEPPTAGPLRRSALFFFVVSLASVALQSRFPHVIGSDGFFHVRAAERVLGGGMPWLPYSVFADGWVDHQLLFHLLMAPFAWLFNGVLAAKLSAAVFAAVAALALYRFLDDEGCPAPAVLALLPFGLSWMFLLRMEMPRTQALSLALLVATLGALARGRPRAVLVLSCLYAWTYHVSLVLVPVAVVYAVVVTARRSGDRGGAWRGALAVVAGLGAGFTLHPHFPRTFRFAWQHVFQKVGNEDALPVGLEWTDGGARWLVGVTDLDLLVAGGGLLALAGAVGLLLRAERRSDLALVVTLLATGSTVAVLSGTKFVEYSVPLSVLALGLALRDAGLGDAVASIRIRGALAAFTAAALLGSGSLVATKVPQSEPHPDELAPAMAWLEQNVPAGETVFHFHWNDFPELVYWGPQYTYIAGLDPHFLYLHDPDRWRLYDALGGAYGGLRSEAIADVFGARWAILRLPHPGAREALAADPGLTPVFDDGQHAIIFEVAP